MKKIAAEKNYKLLKEAATYSLGDLETELTSVSNYIKKVEPRLREVETNGGKQTKLNSEAIAKIHELLKQLVARVVFKTDLKKTDKEKADQKKTDQEKEGQGQ